MRGYFCWSFVDVMELSVGYNASFGLYYVDLDDENFTRYPKQSARWYSSFLKGEKTTSNGVSEIDGRLQNRGVDSSTANALQASI